jgi:hypothetical protein
MCPAPHTHMYKECFCLHVNASLAGFDARLRQPRVLLPRPRVAVHRALHPSSGGPAAVSRVLHVHEPLCQHTPTHTRTLSLSLSLSPCLENGNSGLPFDALPPAKQSLSCPPSRTVPFHYLFLALTRIYSKVLRPVSRLSAQPSVRRRTAARTQEKAMKDCLAMYPSIVAKH